MNCIKFNDKNLLTSITQKQIESYLATNGWSFKHKIPHLSVSVWRKEDAELIVPGSLHFADYPQRIADILVTLGTMNKKPLCEVFTEITEEAKR